MKRVKKGLQETAKRLIQDAEYKESTAANYSAMATRYIAEAIDARKTAAEYVRIAGEQPDDEAVAA